MRIGFIGAGKMGFTMGKHLADHSRQHKDETLVDIQVIGYYSKSSDSAKQAAEFTDTKYYEDISKLVRDCDTLFITTPDGQIKDTADIISKYISDEEKIIIHTSGALTSQIFSGMGSHIYGYSVHPIYAVNSKTESYINFKDAFITIEGHEKYLDKLIKLFSDLGHSVKAISADNKVKYHGAAVFASNLVIGLYKTATELLTQCGFDSDEAEQALMPLFANNANNLSIKGMRDALTGPVARNDVDTVRKHLSVLENDDREIYRLLSEKLVGLMASGDEYDEMKELLK